MIVVGVIVVHLTGTTLNVIDATKPTGECVYVKKEKKEDP